MLTSAEFLSAEFKRNSAKFMMKKHAKPKGIAKVIDATVVP